MSFLQHNLIFKQIIILKKTMFPFSPEEYFKNPKETISKLKEDYHKLEEANSGKICIHSSSGKKPNESKSNDCSIS